LTYEGEFRVPTRLEPGKYQLEIGFSYAGIPPLRGMSEKFDVLIERSK
jgi:hypothetical protein